MTWPFERSTDAFIGEQTGGLDGAPQGLGRLSRTSFWENDVSTTTVLGGKVSKWSMQGTVREYFVATIPFKDARECTKAHTFNHETGEGEQRQLKEGHIKKLRAEMLAGNFTPTPISAGLRPSHLNKLTRVGDEVEMVISWDDPLPLTDGLQRTAALNELLEQARKANDAEQQNAILSLPVTLFVHLDGDTQLDFINLNQGKSVDATHLYSLRLRKDLIQQKNSKFIQVANEAAKRLHKDADSPYFIALRFADTPGMSPIPVKTVCATGASELGTSLVGAAMVMEGSESELAALVIEVYQSLKAGVPELLEGGCLLAPPLPNGTRGSATMLAGVATCVAYYRKAKNVQVASEDETHSLLTAARSALSEKVNGNFSAQRKRALLGQFASKFFTGLNEECHHGIPVGLLKKLSASAFGVPALPRAKTQKPSTTVRKPRKKQEPGEASPTLSA
jgi:hypothetical protein